MEIGVLALQGDFEAHEKTLRGLGATTRQVRTAQELEGLDGLVLPGGESTTMIKLLDEEGLLGPVAEFVNTQPVLATCAGVILLAKTVVNPSQRSLGLLDIDVERNAYGRQVASSIRRVTPETEFADRTEPGELEAVFIRAPIIRTVGEGVRVLARDGDDPILIEQGNILAATFHPELTGDSRIHRLFLDKIPTKAA